MLQNYGNPKQAEFVGRLIHQRKQYPKRLRQVLARHLTLRHLADYAPEMMTYLQRDALLDAGWIRGNSLWIRRVGRGMIGLASSRRWPLSTLAIIWALDRLGRSLPYLLQIATTLQAQGMTFRVLLQELPVIEYKRLQATDLNLRVFCSA